MSNPALASHEISPWYLTIAFLLVLLNAFFVAAEFAMVKVRSTRLETLQESGNFLARWAYAIVQDLNAYLSATQLGITLASLGLGWVGEPAFAALIEPLLRNFALSEATIRGVAFTVAFTVITVLHLLLGELVPKQMAIQTAEKVLLAVAVPMRFFYWIFFPFLWFLNHATTWIIRLMGFDAKAEETHTEDEIRLIVEDSYEEGSLSPRKASLLENIFEFTHRTARQIMVPRQDIVYLQVGKTAKENMDIAKESGHTRFPICDRGPDQHQGHHLEARGQRQPDQPLRPEAPHPLRSRYRHQRPVVARIPEAQIVEIEAVNFLGLPANVVRTAGGVGSIVGAVIGFPFFEDVVKFLLGRRTRRGK